MKKKSKKEYKVPKYTPEYIRIPWQVLSDKNLSFTDKFVYGVILFFYDTTTAKRCTASNEVIANIINTTSATVSNSLVALNKRKHIKREFFDSAHRRRKEIIPVTMFKNKLPRIIQIPVQPMGYTHNGLNPALKSLNLDTPTNDTNTPTNDTDTPTNDRLINIEKSSNNEVKPILNDLKDTDLDTPTNEERESKRKETRENNKISLSFDPSGQDIFEPLVNKAIGKSEGATINDAIALFLPLVPGDFVGKRTAFAKKPTREAVEALLKRYSLVELKELIRKYDEVKNEEYCPKVGDVYEFCTRKLAKIEGYVAKIPSKKLWAQQSISTPEQRADSDEKLAKIIASRREQQQKDKQEWELTHPK